MASAGTTSTHVPYLAEDGAYRQPLASGGRVFIDRPLPFLVVNRHPDVAFSLAQRAAAITPANLVWPDNGDADAEALDCVRTVLRRHGQDEPFLLVSVHDLPQDTSLDDESARLEHYRFALGASADAAAQATADCLGDALSSLCLDLREPVVDRVPQAFPEPGLAELAAGHAGLSCLSLGVPQVYRIPGEERIYPQVFHTLEAGVFDALLQGFAAFLGATGQEAPRHHRALGRSSFIDAAGALQHSTSVANADLSLRSLSGQLHAASSALTYDTIDAGRRALDSRIDGLGDTAVSGGWYRDLASSGTLAQAGHDSIAMDAQGQMIGNDWRVADGNAVVGVAMSQVRQAGWLGALGDRSRGEQREAQLYAAGWHGDWYGQAQLALGGFDREIQRNLLLGSRGDAVSSNPSGNYQSAFAELGHRFEVAGVSQIQERVTRVTCTGHSHIYRWCIEGVKIRVVTISAMVT